MELNKVGHQFPKHPKVLFVTALNSIQISLVQSMKDLGISCAALKSSESIEQILSSETNVLFVGPEVLKLPSVSKVLLKWRTHVVAKVVDEAHLGKSQTKLLNFYNILFLSC